MKFTLSLAFCEAADLCTLARAADRVNQFFCGLHGHDSLLLHVDNGRMSLHCVSCGYDTPGWDLKVRRAA